MSVAAGEPHTFDVAVLGTGGMGRPMARRLLDCGFGMTVYNRTIERARPLADAGARLAATPAAAVAAAGVVLLSLADEHAVDQVLDAAASALQPGTFVLDTSTVGPQYARSAAERLAEAGCRRVEACVLGNPAQALDGQLRVFTAGDVRDVEAVRPVLNAIGREVRHLGAPGSAAAFKLALNLLLGIEVAALAEAVAVGEEFGFDRQLLLDVLTDSGLSSAVMSFRGRMMRERRYRPAAFASRLMAKDLALVIGEAERCGVQAPLGALSGQLFERVVRAGDGDLDAAVLLEHAERRQAGGSR